MLSPVFVSLSEGGRVGAAVDGAAGLVVGASVGVAVEEGAANVHTSSLTPDNTLALIAARKETNI